MERSHTAFLTESYWAAKNIMPGTSKRFWRLALPGLDRSNTASSLCALHTNDLKVRP
jgi:hypothetical protein